ncbi:hypothetical protein LSTR_LSTR001442 [Laodelphax striatellus]|uniref:Uncharacterized protein n=1 Tax=Laodelphax striatellus TaxID=195883 RepID=A0A482XAC8_LAOST|nr:hypothetical protein LSTR_LSTR001442 [Laodelphax striatellus]
MPGKPLDTLVTCDDTLTHRVSLGASCFLATHRGLEERLLLLPTNNNRRSVCSRLPQSHDKFGARLLSQLFRDARSSNQVLLSSLVKLLEVQVSFQTFSYCCGEQEKSWRKFETEFRLITSGTSVISGRNKIVKVVWILTLRRSCIELGQPLNKCVTKNIVIIKQYNT